jgi:O-antigen/teichoic acid export membrane protein
MDLVVLAVVIALGIVTLASAVAGLAIYHDQYARNSTSNLLAGTSATAFGSAIVLCAVYTKLPFTVAGYIVPLSFCALGLLYLVVGLVGRQRENREQVSV